MRRLIVFMTLALVVGLLAIPAAAKPKRTGTQFDLLTDCLAETEIVDQVAGQGFHVAHGFDELPNETRALGQWRFELWVDGAKQRRHVEVDRAPDGTMERRYVTNFPQGLDGSHVFHAVWSDPDGVVLDCTRVVEFT